MKNIFLFGCIIAMALVLGCGGGEKPASTGNAEPEEQGNAITLNVEGQSYEFKKAEPWVFKKFDLSPGEYWLETAAHDPELNTVVLYFATRTTAPAALVGEQFAAPDYSADNPEKGRRSPDWVLNRFQAGGKWYQGYRMAGRVTAVTDASVTVEINSTFLEFDYDEPEVDDQGNPKDAPPGREVTVTGTVSLPLRDESQL